MTRLTDTEIDDLGRLLARLLAPHLAEPGVAAGESAVEAMATGEAIHHRQMAAAMRAQSLSKSEVIRRLFRDEKLSRSEIATALDVRYQFVQNVLKQAGLLQNAVPAASGD